MMLLNTSTPCLHLVIRIFGSLLNSTLLPIDLLGVSWPRFPSFRVFSCHGSSIPPYSSLMYSDWSWSWSAWLVIRCCITSVLPRDFAALIKSPDSRWILLTIASLVHCARGVDLHLIALNRSVERHFLRSFLDCRPLGLPSNCSYLWKSLHHCDYRTRTLQSFFPSPYPLSSASFHNFHRPRLIDDLSLYAYPILLTI